MQTSVRQLPLLTLPGVPEPAGPTPAGRSAPAWRCPADPEAPFLPRARGPLSAFLIEHLRRPPHEVPFVPSPRVADPLVDEDLQLALYVAYELHYRGFAGVDETWEWQPSLLALRQLLERTFESALLDRVGHPAAMHGEGRDLDLALRAIVEGDDSPSLSRHVEHRATRAQILEFLVHRSAYQLKEADPHSWALPRLHGRPKAAMVEIQADEYGGGRPERIHARLFADVLAACGLDPAYGGYLNRIPGVTLATVNLMSLLGLHRRWRGAIVGHLALFEMTSSLPNRRYASGMRRLGYEGAALEFFDEHVVADAVHENVAAVDLAGGLALQQPALAGSILWGAHALLALEADWTEHVLSAWQAGRSSLFEPCEIDLEQSAGVLGAA